MDLFLPLVLELATVVFCIKFLNSKLKKTWQLLTNTASTQAALNAGSSEKAKELTDKPRASDPAAAQMPGTPGMPGMQGMQGMQGMPGADGNMMGTGMIPDMRGMTGEMPNGGGMPVSGGAAAVGVVGVANAVLMGPQSGNIHNIMAAHRQIIGPVRQAGMMYNIKPKGLKSIGNQNAQAITNQINGKVVINQTGNTGSRTNIASGSKIAKLEAGNSTINTKGETKIRAPRGKIHARESSEIIAPRSKVYRITGVSQASQLDKRFYGNRQVIERAQAYNEGILPEKVEHYTRIVEPGSRIVYLQRERERRLESRELPPVGNAMYVNGGGGELPPVRNAIYVNGGRGESSPVGNAIYVSGGGGESSPVGNAYIESRNSYETESKERFLADPRNSALTEEQKNKLWELERLIKIDKAIQHNDNGAFMRSIADSEDRDLSKVVVLMAPKDTSARDMKFIFDRAKENKELNQKVAIGDETRQRVDDSNMEALNQILQETAVSKKFDSYLEKNMDDENNTLLSKEDLERIKKQALENVEKDKSLTLEERELRLKELEEKMKKDLGRDRLKQEIIEDPDAAVEILGTKAVNELKQAIEKNEKNMEKIYEQVKKEFKKRDKEESNKGKYKRRATDFEAYRQRRQQNNIAAVQAAIGDYENGSLPSQLHTAEEYNHMNNVG